MSGTCQSRTGHEPQSIMPEICTSQLYTEIGLSSSLKIKPVLRQRLYVSNSWHLDHAVPPTHAPLHHQLKKIMTSTHRHLHAPRSSHTPFPLIQKSRTTLEPHKRTLLPSRDKSILRRTPHPRSLLKLIGVHTTKCTACLTPDEAFTSDSQVAAVCTWLSQNRTHGHSNRLLCLKDNRQTSAEAEKRGRDWRQARLSVSSRRRRRNPSLRSTSLPILQLWHLWSPALPGLLSMCKTNPLKVANLRVAQRVAARRHGGKTVTRHPRRKSPASVGLGIWASLYCEIETWLGITTTSTSLCLTSTSTTAFLVSLSATTSVAFVAVSQSPNCRWVWHRKQVFQADRWLVC